MKTIFLLSLLFISCAVQRPINPPPLEWEGGRQDWIKFEECVGEDISDFKCDSCYRAVFHRFPKP